MDPTQSATKISEPSSISCSSVHRILITLKIHPYEMTQVKSSRFIAGNLNEATHLEILENTIDLMMTKNVENDENLLENQLMF